MSRHDLHSSTSASSPDLHPARGREADTPRDRLSVHEANRVKKAVESNVKAVENRIRFFQREEEKIWRDLEEVRRQAATIEDGRTRALEKRMADRTIRQARESMLEQNQKKAFAMKQANQDSRKRNQYQSVREKQLAGQDQRRVSQDYLRQKRMQEAQVRLQNTERAVAIQRAQLEAKLKASQQKSERIEMLREQQEAEKAAAEAEVQEVESRLPALEAEEMMCLQRLQNSRIVTQSVLEELESSLGSRSSVTSLLRSKQRPLQEKFSDVREGCSEDASSPGKGLEAVPR